MTEPSAEVPAQPDPTWLASNEVGYATSGPRAASGHVIVRPHRLVTWWELGEGERIALWSLVDELKARLDLSLAPRSCRVVVTSAKDGAARIELMPESGLVDDDFVDGEERTLLPRLIDCLRDPHLDRVDLVVSFIMKSGLQLIRDPLEDAIERGAAIRILTTDYLEITDADALARLLDLADVWADRFQVRIFQDRSTSFHPKAYLFHSRSEGPARAFVGSSNLSRSGIAGGVEWSIGVDDVTPLIRGFDRLWNDTRTCDLTHQFLREYRMRWHPERPAHPEVEIEPPARAPEPRPVQREALDALEATRIDGHSAGLVVMATGLGKTWLAAFDTARPSFRRILFIAHREEILRQSRDVFRAVQPDADLGLFTGTEKSPGARILFASVASLAIHLDAFGPEEFDYVVVDEFHHAAATSYRRVLDHFRPRFLLGLTATPERMDGADLLALCNDNLVFEATLVEGIRRGDLAPFDYFGIRDSVDYTPIPWRGGRFEPEALTEAVATQDRAEQVLDEWRQKGGGPTLGFCVTIAHAEFMANYFRGAGVDAVAVHSQPGSAPRRQAIEDLRDGRLQMVFSVDVFNEGLDVPEIETVLMLRPTESPVVFLQQLGRGLRRTAQKARLVVIDFIGNHRSFLLKPRTLLAAATGTSPSTRAVLDAMRTGEFSLPNGCSVMFDVEAVDMLSKLARVSVRNALREFCLSYAVEEGRRPTAVQAWRAGHNPAAARSTYNGWFGLLDDLGLLSDQESEVWAAHGDVLAGIEAEQITKAYKLVTLQAMLQDDSLRSGAEIGALANTAHRIIAGDPRLVADARSGKEMPDPVHVDEDAWRDYWRRWPLAAWAGELSGKPGKWFRIDGDRFVPTFAIPDEQGQTFDAMVAELVDWRLARHLLTRAVDGNRTSFRLRVSQSNGRPLLWLDRDRNEGLPEGEVGFIADGNEYTGNFVKIALNVARRTGSGSNDLHELLRRWFGTAAGQPGTEHWVELERTASGWVMRPLANDGAGAKRDAVGTY
jgi:superfamily II DNA or RNA helicase/HKD family nuclease